MIQRVSRWMAAAFCCSSFLANAQAEHRYHEDLAYLYHAVQKTPGYKAQIRGSRKQAFAKLYEELKAVQPADAFQAYYQLSQLLLPIRDNHLGFYQIPKAYLQPAQFADTAAVRRYRATEAFQQFPATNLSLDSLEAILRNRPADSIEGIYHYGHFLKAGLFRTGKRDSLVAVVLQSQMPNWVPGQVAFVLRQTDEQRFHAWYAHPVFKSFTMVRTERLMRSALANGLFYSSVTDGPWQKFPAQPDFVNLRGVPIFSFKNLEGGVQYLRLGSFDASTEGLKKSAAFFEKIRDSLTASCLVLDLRNNTGGGFKASRKYLKLVRHFAKKGTVYVMANYHTISNGEQFLLKLKGRRNIRVLGQPTKGMIAYGSNYGRRLGLPSGTCQFYPTDMRDWGGYSKYEDVGVAPDVPLDINRDWIEQVMEQIGSTK